MNPARNPLILAAAAAGPQAKSTPRWQRWLLASAAALSLAACGGGGGIAGSGTATDSNAGTTVAGGGPTAGGGAATTPGGGGTTTPGGGTTVGTDLSYGGITAFGSVWVNGVEFKTDGASIRLDDSAVTQSQLRVGMVVRVEGSISTATAGTLVVEDAVKGYVEAVTDANRLVVMGQTIQLDVGTRFENNVRPAFAVGDAVHVHGLVVSAGTVSAGYVEKKTALGTPPFAVKGIVASHNATAKTFRVGTLTVNYASATTSDMSGTAWDGQHVEVKGSACAARPTCTTLTATKVEPAGLQAGSSSTAREAEVEGFVTTVSATTLTVAGQSVTLTGSTRYEGGVFSDILVGTKLEVEGKVTNGVLVAEKVSFRDSVRLEGNVASVNSSTGTLTLSGFPLAIRANSLTSFDKISGLSGLVAGNHLRIRGRLVKVTDPTTNVETEQIQATELIYRSASSDTTFYVQGPIASFSANTLVLMGVSVNTSGVPDIKFTRSVGSSSGSTYIGRSAFLAALKTGTVVKAKGKLSGSSISWEEIELESD